MNVLCSGVHNSTALLDIIDCTNCCAVRHTKDAEYVANTMKPCIVKLDPHKTCTDLIIFDDASNVKKDSRILAAYDPQITVMHGACHVTSSFAKDVTETREVGFLCKIHKQFCNFCGSTHHSPHAMFCKHCEAMNNGVYLGFIKSMDTRMAGNLIALQRFL